MLPLDAESDDLVPGVHCVDVGDRDDPRTSPGQATANREPWGRVEGDADLVDAADDPAAGVRDDVSPGGGEHVGVVGANGHAESLANAWADIPGCLSSNT